MIGALTGSVFTNNKNPIILFVGGVGYAVHIPVRVTRELTAEKIYTLFIHTHVREDALDLYGFLTQEDLALFELLLDVSGIGPRTALAVLDRGAESVRHAIVEGDVDFFVTIPRLGRKNAQKIIIELKSKLGSLTDLDLSDDAQSETKQLFDALLSMGFDRKEAISIVKKVPSALPLEEKIRTALQLLREP